MAKNLTDALAALSDSGQGQTSRQNKKLAPVNDPPAIPERSGTGSPKRSSEGGIASPLTETDYADREFNEALDVVTTTDGLFTLTVKRLRKLKMKDARGNVVEFNFKAPT